MNDQPARTDAPSKTDVVRSIAELLLALVLVGIGLWQLFRLGDPVPAWVPLALIGLALVFYTLRGRVLSDAEIGPGGVKITMADLARKAQAAEQKAEAAEVRAEAAEKTANFSKTVATQIGPSLPGPSGEAAEGLRSAWAHPNLKRPKKPPSDDPQKGQWGGEAERNGRILEAEVTPTDEPEWFEVRLDVRSTDPAKPLTGRVRFHLHDSYRVSKVTVKPKNGVASIERYAYGAFTVGAEVENEPDTFLELDLVDVEAPAKFKAR
jgi:hypothetical protein